MSQRKKIIAGNWKMHKSISEAQLFIEELTPKVKETKHQVWLAVPFTCLRAVADLAMGSDIVIGAQNISEHPQGAYTGEISAVMAHDAGAEFTLIGHSERRQHFGESDLAVNAKIKRALSEGLRPLVCFGETLTDRQNNQTQIVVERQLIAILSDLKVEELSKLTLAYEPIWAIGSGLVASVEQAVEVHSFCRSLMVQQFGREAAEVVPILYGGSVNATNAAGLLYHKEIDGVLVGSASLAVESFSNIVNFQNMQLQKIASAH